MIIDYSVNVNFWNEASTSAAVYRQLYYIPACQESSNIVFTVFEICIPEMFREIYFCGTGHPQMQKICVGTFLTLQKPFRKAFTCRILPKLLNDSVVFNGKMRTKTKQLCNRESPGHNFRVLLRAFEQLHN